MLKCSLWLKCFQWSVRVEKQYINVTTFLSSDGYLCVLSKVHPGSIVVLNLMLILVSEKQTAQNVEATGC